MEGDFSPRGHWAILMISTGMNSPGMFLSILQCLRQFFLVTVPNAIIKADKGYFKEDRVYPGLHFEEIFPSRWRRHGGRPVVDKGWSCAAIKTQRK